MNLPPNAYNCSIIRHEGKLLLVCRSHDRGDWRTSLFIAELNPDFSIASVNRIAMPDEVAENSAEDGRLFIHNNALHISWTNSLYPATVFRSVVSYGRLTHDANGWRVSCTIPQHGRNDFSACEKNWTPFVHQNELWCLYLTDERTTTFIRLDGGKVVETVHGKRLPWAWGDLHGGAIVPRKDGRLLHFFSSRTNPGNPERNRYHIGCAEHSRTPPFDMLHISRRPIVYGEEGYNLDKKLKTFKASVAFPCGAIADGEGWLLAYGWNDCQCRLLKLSESDFILK